LDYFLVHKLDCMNKDSLESSHPINTEVNDPNEINSLFDEISYDKVKISNRTMNKQLIIIIQTRAQV
jgi:hypothetical protein